MASVAAFVTLLIALLIAGCVSEHAKTSSTAPDAIANSPETLSVKITAATPKAVANNPVAPASVAATALKTVTPPAISGPETLYVVIPGDTLNRIAKLHQTTVKALKSVNSLNGDTIAIGTKLKLPTG